MIENRSETIQSELLREPRPGAILSPATPNRKRGKSMSFRSGQSGSIVKKGQMWHGRYYIDVPGQAKRRKVSVPLGSIHSLKKPEAKRKLRSLLEEVGLNCDNHLERITITRTFGEEAAWWRENKLSLFKPSCQEGMGSHLDKYILPRFGSLPLTSVDEKRVQEFIADLARTKYRLPNGSARFLSPKSIRNVVGVVKQVLGIKVWRDWTLRFPECSKKEQRFFSPEESLAIIDEAKGQWKLLFATLACTGLRCGECFGLHIEDLDLANGQVHVRRSVWNGQELTTKTQSGNRVVNIEPKLVEMLAAHVGTRKTGRVFQTRTGTPFSKGNVRRKLREILKKLKLPMGGLHAFRHGRVSLLQQLGIPDDLRLKWIGHSSLDMSRQYTHFPADFRKQSANAAGLFNVGPNGPNSEQNREPASA